MQETRVAASRGGEATIEQRARSKSYALWTIEELRALAGQLQLPGATVKTRRELLELLDSGYDA